MKKVMLVNGIEYEVKSMPDKCARAYNILDIPDDGILRFKKCVTIHNEVLTVEEVHLNFRNKELAEKVKKNSLS